MCPISPLTDDEIKAKSGRVVKQSRSDKVGEQIGNIELPSTSGKMVNIKNISENSNVVLFFYPGNRIGLEFPELMGCTPESCSFRDNIQEFSDANTVVLGVSMQSTEVQSNFVQENHLRFEILSDSQGQLADTLGVDIWQTLDGDKTFTARETVFIKEGGEIKLHVKDITFSDIDTHVADLLDMVKKSLSPSCCM